MPRLSWRKQPNEKGLAVVCQRERGLEMRYDGETIAAVYPLSGKNRYDTVAWYFVTYAGKYCVPMFNSYSERQIYQTKEGAKIECDKYVRTHFKGAGDDE